MSLTSFLDMQDVIEKVKPLRPGSPRKIDAVLRVEPRSDHYTIVGTAFDYLLRFEGDLGPIVPGLPSLLEFRL
jgi:hypothetical protein